MSLGVVMASALAAGKDGGGLDASWIAAAATILAAATAAIVAVWLHRSGQKENRRDRKREMCARAVADALAWMELPYRIRRRVDDDPATIHELADAAHQLQEALFFHDAWLRFEMPEAGTGYGALVSACKSAVGEAIQEAWTSPPASQPGNMIIGNLSIDRSGADRALAVLTETMRRHLG